MASGTTSTTSPRQQGVPDAVVKAMAGRAGTDVAARGQDKHLHYSRGVTVEEMRQASMALTGQA